jgi:hypothetical protein
MLRVVFEVSDGETLRARGSAFKTLRIVTCSGTRRGRLSSWVRGSFVGMRSGSVVLS